MSTSGGYHEYIGGVQYIGGYHDACGGYHEYIGVFNIIERPCSPTRIMIPRCTEHPPT